MQKVNAFANYLRFAVSSPLLIASMFVVISGAAIGLTTFNQPHVVSAASDNDVIYGGASSPSDFAAKYKINTPGDLPALYQNFGLNPSDIDRFASTAKMGTAYKDGRVVVDGQVVATNANSLGRTELGGKNNVPITIGGKTYYWGSNSRNFGSDALPVMVMMNPDTHDMQFAALTACGNPVWGNSPKYKCNILNREQVNRTTFSFSANVVAENGAIVSRVVYDFGDGKTETRTNPAEKVSHTYAIAGSYTAKVTVYFSVNGQEKSDTRAECAKPVEVKAAPDVACSALTAHQITRTKYEFTASSTATGGATLKNGSFDFGDGQKVQNVSATGDTVVTQHEYAKDGSYTIKATLNFDVEGSVTAKTCELKISVSPETCPINPSYPKGSPECEVCEYDHSLPKNSDKCKKPETPTSLPNTGSTEILGGTLGLGSVVTAGGYYIRSRRSVLSAVFNKKR